MAPFFEVLPSTPVTQSQVRSLTPLLTNGIKQNVKEPKLLKFRPAGGIDLVNNLAKEVETKARVSATPAYCSSITKYGEWERMADTS